ncbi:MAG: hypothetical protein ACREM6_04955, partial [Vulcanimicrobiaceae bacterium]
MPGLFAYALPAYSALAAVLGHRSHGSARVAREPAGSMKTNANGPGASRQVVRWAAVCAAAVLLANCGGG